jgi:hypothetical protein
MLENHQGGESMSKNIWKLLMMLVLLSFFSTGCYYFAARNEMKTAEKLLAELKGAGGATLVPYEYCSAQSFLEMANLEADQNDWKHAKDFANRSKSAAEAGLAEVKKKK